MRRNIRIAALLGISLLLCVARAEHDRDRDRDHHEHDRPVAAATPEPNTVATLLMGAGALLALKRLRGR